LRKYLQLSLILTTSGSEGWHLFVLSAQFHPIAEWVLLLKRTADSIGAEIRAGMCEIFPKEPLGTSRPHAIRAPGTWNPKTNQLGKIIFESITPDLQKKEKKEVSSFLYHSISGSKTSQLNDSEEGSFYSGGEANWIQQFAIVQPSTRHGQLRALVHVIFRQVGHCVARRNADAQYLGAKFEPNATLAEHLEEFEKLWDWTAKQWQEELSELERKRLTLLGTEVERDLFRILRSFAVHANSQGAMDFPFPIQHVGNRLGVSFQHVSKLRRHFIDSGIIVQTEPARTNRRAARFRWSLAMD
jgi:hypothetical protein